MYRISLLFVLTWISIQCYTQIDVKGKVTDAQTGEPLIGASIVIKGTTKGTVTNVDGEFSLSTIPPDEVITVSYIGYLSEEFVTGSQSYVEVLLVPDITQIDAVVVTALGIKREKKGLGYSIQDLDGEDLNQTEQDLLNSLSGKIAGVQITGSNGAIGSSAVVKIRGNKSFSSNSQPLYVIDGTPMVNASGNARSSGNVNIDFGNAAMDIDPSNIENISVLKGPNAAAMYGSRGANGVILITTKTADEKKKGIGVQFSSSASMDKAYFFPNYQNDYGQGFRGSEFYYNEYIENQFDGDFSQMSYNEYVDQRSFRFDLEGDAVNLDADESWGGRLDQGLFIDQMHGKQQPWISQPDNIKDFFETGVNYKNNLSLTAANENAQTRVSFSHQDSKGIIPNTDKRLFSIGTNSSINLGKKLTATINATYTSLNNDNLPSLGRNFRNPFYSLNGWFGRQVDLGYVKDHYEDIVDVSALDYSDDNGNPIEAMAFNWMMGYPDQHANPYWVLYKNTMSRNRNRLYGNVSLNYEIIEGISVLAKMGIDSYNEKRNYIYHQYTRKDWTLFDKPQNGAFDYKTKLAYERNFDIMLLVDKRLSSDFHLNATAGANFLSAEETTNTITANELITPDIFNTANIFDKPEVSYYLWRKKTNSVYSSANIGFRSYLFLDLAIRGDWSSTLPKDNWNYWYPSTGLGFIFTDAFGIESNILNYGKVRAGYAVAGNDASAYSLDKTINAVDNTFKDVKMYYLSTQINTPDLKPELTHSFESGLEMKFLGNRTGFDVTYYQSNTFNQLMSLAVPYSSGYNSWYKNAGDIKNSGIELNVYGTPITNSNGFAWDIDLNWWTNKNEVIELSDDMEYLQLGTSYSNADIYLIAQPGEPFGAIQGYKQKRNDNGDLLITDRGYPIREDSLSIIGNIQPDWEAGLRNTLRYKGFTLSAMLKFRKGGDVVSVTKSIGQRTGILNVTAEGGIRENGMVVPGVYEEGSQDNEGNDISGQPNTTVVSAQSYWQDSREYSELSIFDGSYLKLGEVTFSYTIPSKLTEKVGIQQASLTFFTRNTAILWIHDSNDAHIDPEVAAGPTISGSGLEESQVPAPRTLGLKLNLAF